MAKEAPRPPYDVGNLLRLQRYMLSGGRPVAAGERQETAVLAPSLIRQTARVLRHRWPWGLISCAVVVLATFVWGFTASRQYMAQGSLILTQNVTGSSGLDSLLSWRVYFSNVAVARLASLPDTHHTASLLLREWLRDPATRPANLPDLSGDAPTTAALADLTPLDLASLVSATPDTQNVAVDIEVWHENGALALYAAQALLEALQDEVIEYEKSVLDVEGLGAQARLTQQALADIEQQIRMKYAESTDKGVLPHQLSRTLEALEAVNEEIERTKLEKKETEQRAETLRTILASPEGVTGETATPQFLIQQLLSQELLLDDYLKRYTEAHPKVKKLRREIAALRETINRVRGEPEKYGIAQERSRTYRDQRVGESLAYTEARVASLEVRLGELAIRKANLEAYFKQEGGSVATVEARELEQRRTALQSFLQDLNVRIEQMKYLSERISAKDPVFTKVEAVAAQVRPEAPPKGAVYLISLLVGLLAALLVMFQIEAMDTTVHDIERVQSAAGLPVLGTIAFQNKDPFIYPENPRTPTANIFALLRNHVRFSGPDKPEKLLAITSPRPDEGKSYIAVNLAISFAQEGNRVLLVDADLRRHADKVYREALLIPGESEAAGLCHFLESGDLDVSAVVHPTEMENLFVVPAGGIAQNPPRLLRSARLAEFIQTVAQEFDTVIVDCPPALPVVDGSLMAEKARATVIVCGWGQTHYRDIEEAVKRLRTVRAAVAGIVINKAPFSHRDYSYYYGHEYPETG